MHGLRRFFPRTLAAAVAAVGVQSAAAQAPVERVVPAQRDDLPAIVEAPIPTAAPAVPDAAACAASGGGGCDSCGGGFDFKKVPPVRPLTRTGMFAIPPSGKGAYNLLAHVRGQETDGPPKFGYPPFALMQFSFFDADFRYLDDPKTPPQDALDRLKRVRLGDDWLLAVGGQVWNRYHGEYNSRLTQRDNTYNLFRARVFTDLWYRDQFRLFAELNSTHVASQDLPPLPIDESGPDIQNLFVDVKLGEVRNAPVYLRAGRQELLLGSQRLVSPLDWGNTRRTFQGLRLLRTGEKFDFDAFVLQPVVPNANRLDSGDNNQLFAGAYATYRPKKGQAADLYYFLLDNTNRTVQQGIARNPSTVHTIGGRYYGDRDAGECHKLLWDAEAAVQFGERGRQDVIAGMISTGLGVNWKKAPLNPTFWVYYDYASGDDSPNAGDHFTTFNQLFPFGHFYMGWTDLIGRQNVHDVNCALYLYPTKWLTVWTQYHNFWLDNVRDGLYNVAGNAVRRDPTGRASPFLGHEVDLITNFHLSKRTDLLFSYAHLFGGGFLRDTAGPNAAVNASVLTCLFSVRY
jgi:hypothetical protein